ncbi:heterokaryon incompatibility protein-domain-containing protein [Phlebopus sp. FC_14]|nr:heterokaryon incompatibility protein-domain-containing protein [Phlebopus sp. FC_14]
MLQRLPIFKAEKKAKSSNTVTVLPGIAHSEELFERQIQAIPEDGFIPNSRPLIGRRAVPFAEYRVAPIRPPQRSPRAHIIPAPRDIQPPSPSSTSHDGPQSRYLERSISILALDGTSDDEQDTFGHIGRRLPSSPDIITDDNLRSATQSHVFGQMPIRVVKLPEMTLMERDVLLQYLIDKFMHTAGIDQGGGWPPTIQQWLAENARFAILSHTWEQQELSCKDLRKQRNLHFRGYKKLKRFCDIAYEKHGIEFAWMDTVCIDKSSSAELDESIRSMFNWYRNSFICIAYLSGTTDIVDMEWDRWFKRGWTLQELLAPNRIKFYDKYWSPLTHLENEKASFAEWRVAARLDWGYFSSDVPSWARELKVLGDVITTATGINFCDEACPFVPGFDGNNIAKRMSWIANRRTTRGEDMSYCMMGVFDVSMSISYGEGPERAFFRLFRTILDVTNDPRLFQWAGAAVARNVHPSRMIPASAACYLPAASLPHPGWDWVAGTTEPVIPTSAGIPMKLLVVPVMLSKAWHPSTPPPRRFDEVLPDESWPDFRPESEFSGSPGLCHIQSRLFHRDEIVEATLVSATVPDYDAETFALGIPYGSLGHNDTLPAKPWVILLRKLGWQKTWQRVETEEIIFFQCSKAFLRMRPDALCRVKFRYGGLLDKARRITLETVYL